MTLVAVRAIGQKGRSSTDRKIEAAVRCEETCEQIRRAWKGLCGSS